MILCHNLDISYHLNFQSIFAKAWQFDFDLISDLVFKHLDPKIIQNPLGQTLSLKRIYSFKVKVPTSDDITQCKNAATPMKLEASIPHSSTFKKGIYL